MPHKDRTCPPLDATLLHAEDEYGTTLDHGSPLGIVEATGNAWNDALPCGMDETKGMDGGLDITDEWRYVGIAGHFEDV
jgi:hypothetical protein